MKKLFILAVGLFLLSVVLYVTADEFAPERGACKCIPADPNLKSSVTLIGEGETKDWEVKIVYNEYERGSGHLEIPHIRYRGSATLDPQEVVRMDIKYTNNSETSNDIIGNSLQDRAWLTLPTRSVIEDLEDVKEVRIMRHVNNESVKPVMHIIELKQVK